MGKAWAYYSEFEPHAAAWLRNLIALGVIAPGEVDERSILDVAPDDLRGFRQCHFFAGIGVWSYALRLAGWDDDRPVWTGSCPCQPFSAAGKGGGFADERHLWPAWFKIIQACRPPVIFGEQVASPLVLGSTVQGVRRAKAVGGFPPGRDISEGGVPDLRADYLLAHTDFQREEFGVEPEAPREAPGFFLSTGREAEVGGAGPPVRPDRGVCSREDRRGSLRGVGVAFRPDDAARVERSVTRPEDSERGLHDGEYAGGPLRGQRDDADVGREPDSRSCERDYGPSSREIEQIVLALGRGREESEDRVWLDALQLDMERAGYTAGASVFGSASVGAPHRRYRTYWCALADAGRAGRRLIEAPSLRAAARHDDADGLRRSGGLAIADEKQRGRRSIYGERQRDGKDGGRSQDHREPTRRRQIGLLVEPERARLEGQRRDGGDRDQPGREREIAARPVASAGGARGLADAAGQQRNARRFGAEGVEPREIVGPARYGATSGGAEIESGVAFAGGDRWAGPTNGFWRNADWLLCRDGKWRPVEPGTQPLVDGSAFDLDAGGTLAGKSRAKLLAGYGNAINAQQAAEFIRSTLDA